MSDEPRKRSRFDQTEPKRPSRFDRRSRSPPARHSRDRTRSPISSRSPTGSAADKLDPKAAAAAAAARINASISSRVVDMPPPPPSAPPAPRRSNHAASVTDEIYTQDGDYIKDIEINDLRNRYTLTKGATQKLIKDETGADVTTRGEYYPDKTMSTPSAPPLYLHITSTSKEGLEKAIAKIEEMMKQDLPNLVDERRFRRREQDGVERDEFGRRKWPEEKIPIDLEPIPGFNLRAQVVGAGGAYVKHIQNETRCRVQIKGRGSEFKNPRTNQEDDEPMFLHVAGPDPDMVKEAKKLCIDLLDNVKLEYERFKERGASRNRGYGGYGNDRGGGQGDYGRAYQAGYGSQPEQGASAASPTSATSAEYAAHIAQYYGGVDPYAAYGGYQNYMTLYYQYYQQQATGEGAPPGVAAAAPGAAPGTAGASAPPPPPPPSDAPGGAAPPPPPPPPPGAPSGGYNNVPPPPGL